MLFVLGGASTNLSGVGSKLMLIKEMFEPPVFLDTLERMLKSKQEPVSIQVLQFHEHSSMVKPHHIIVYRKQTKRKDGVQLLF